MADQFYSVTQTAELLGCTYTRALRFAERNDLPCLGARYIFSESAMDQLEKELAEGSEDEDELDDEDSDVDDAADDDE